MTSTHPRGAHNVSGTPRIPPGSRRRLCAGRGVRSWAAGIPNQRRCSAAAASPSPGPSTMRSIHPASTSRRASRCADRAGFPVHVLSEEPVLARVDDEDPFRKRSWAFELRDQVTHLYVEGGPHPWRMPLRGASLRPPTAATGAGARTPVGPTSARSAPGRQTAPPPGGTPPSPHARTPAAMLPLGPMHVTSHSARRAHRLAPYERLLVSGVRRQFALCPPDSDRRT